MVTVRAVADMPSLQLTVRAGESRLGQRISRIYGTELPDPGRFLSGGELVITGLLWLRDDADIAPFVTALADRGVAGLIACDADTGMIRPALVAACERHGVPLLEAVPDLSFAVIIERVGMALATERIAGPTGVRAHHRRLMAALARGAGLAELLELAAGELGAPCWVLTPLGRVVAGTAAAPPGERLAALVREFLQADGRPRRVRGPGGVITVLPVPDAGGQDLTRWFLVFGGEITQGDPAHEEIVADLVGLVGAQRYREEEARRVANQVAGPLVRAILAGSARPEELTATALAAGLDLRRPVRVLAATAPGGGTGRAAAVLAELIAAVHTVGLVGPVDDRAYALVTDDRADPGHDLTERAGRALRLLESGLAGGRVLVGISSPATVTELRGAAQEAGHARDVAERGPGRTAVVAGNQVPVHQLLLATAPEELRRALRRRVLGAVFDYDAEHDGSLIETLTVFLDCSGSWSRAAARLHVHVNTLRYRIGRVAELTGADLSDFTHRVDIYLALRADT